MICAARGYAVSQAQAPGPAQAGLAPPVGWARRQPGYLLLHRRYVAVSLIAAVVSNVRLLVKWPVGAL
jgi:hypothetical protein